MGAQAPMVHGVVADLEARLFQARDLLPGHVPVLAGLEPIGLGDVEGRPKSMLLQKRPDESGMALAAVIEGEHDGLVRDGLAQDAIGIEWLGRRHRDRHGRGQDAGKRDANRDSLHRRHVHARFSICVPNSHGFDGSASSQTRSNVALHCIASRPTMASAKALPICAKVLRLP